jgi:hypothetical protein
LDIYVNYPFVQSQFGVLQILPRQYKKAKVSLGIPQKVLGIGGGGLRAARRSKPPPQFGLNNGLI